MIKFGLIQYITSVLSWICFPFCLLSVD